MTDNEREYAALAVVIALMWWFRPRVEVLPDGEVDVRIINPDTGREIVSGDDGFFRIS